MHCLFFFFFSSVSKFKADFGFMHIFMQVMVGEPRCGCQALGNHSLHLSCPSLGGVDTALTTPLSEPWTGSRPWCPPTPNVSTSLYYLETEKIWPSPLKGHTDFNKYRRITKTKPGAPRPPHLPTLTLADPVPEHCSIQLSSAASSGFGFGLGGRSVRWVYFHCPSKLC